MNFHFIRHSGASRNPAASVREPKKLICVLTYKYWIPAFAGMTLVVVFLFGLITLAHAVQPDEMLKDPALEARARVISKDMRCLVCQNQSIDDSDAPLARDLRVLLRQRLTAGDTDAQARAHIVQRYGDYVLLTPPFKPATSLLWLGPGFFLLIALGAMIGFYRKGRRT